MLKTETKQQELSVSTVVLNDKQSAPFLVPDLQDSQELAVVDKGVLGYLTKLLPTANFTEIRYEFIQKLKDTQNLQGMVDCAKQEIVFHETCNLLARFFDPKVKVTLTKPLNTEPQIATIEDLTWLLGSFDEGEREMARDICVRELGLVKVFATPDMR